jgi:3-methyladenine DNA glycosylase AlkD
MLIGGASEEVAANMQIVGTQMAEAAGVAPGRVMKDMAKNGKLLAKSMAGNAKGMMEVAVYAAQMGSDIEGMVKMTDSLLDIETSLNAQMQYQAI